MTTDNENTPNTEAETVAELAKPEDAEFLYIEQRQEDEADARPPEDETDKLARDVREKYPELKEQKKASRYERLKRARDQFKAEAEQLRQKYEPRDTEQPEYSSAETRAPSDVDNAPLERSLEAAQHLHGDAFHKAYEAFVDHCARTKDQAAYQRVMNSADQGAELVQWWNEQGNPSPSPEAYEAAMQQGRQQQEFQQQLAARDEEIRVQTEVRLREEAYARENPRYHETVQTLDGLLDGFPPVAADLMRRSPVGPEMLFYMAHDYWEPNSAGILDQALATANDPIAQARFVGQFEQAILTSRSKGGLTVGNAQGRATKAPPPLSPVRGGASAPRDLHSLSKGDDVSDYIRARRGA